MCVFKGFTGDFHGVSTRLVGHLTFCKVQAPESTHTHTSKRVGWTSLKKSKVQLAPCWTVPWTYRTVQASTWGVVHRYSRGAGGYKVTLVLRFTLYGFTNVYFIYSFFNGGFILVSDYVRMERLRTVLGGVLK